jgi:tRNA pseudouridine55 synthase
MNGVLVVDKPAGPTSHDVVARVRRALRTPRIGHTGTLDPLATGVLPLVVGKATRLAQFLVADEKEYVADVRFGASTETYDAEVPPFVSGACTVTAAAIEACLDEFRGTYQQIPPPFSAKKISGRPAYRLARARKHVEVPAAEVTVKTLELLSFENGVGRLRIVSSGGFYVRALAHDLGQRAGCGAHVASLKRVRAGDFSLDQAAPLDDVEREGMDAGRRLIAMERLLVSFPSVVVNERGAQRTCHGNALTVEDLAGGHCVTDSPRVRLLDDTGMLLGIAERHPGGLLHPSVVLV